MKWHFADMLGINLSTSTEQSALDFRPGNSSVQGNTCRRVNDYARDKHASETPLKTTLEHLLGRNVFQYVMESRAYTTVLANVF